MIKPISLFTIIPGILFSSCSALKTNISQTAGIEEPRVIQTPVLVDLKVEEIKICGTASGGIGISIETLQGYAVEEALNKEDADVLVQPKFETETIEGHTTVTVTGYPGRYNNFRPMKPEDVPLVQCGVMQKAEVYNQPAKAQKNGTAALIGVATFFALVLFTIVIISM